MVMVKLFRHRQTKKAATDKPNLKRLSPVLYSTLTLENDRENKKNLPAPMSGVRRVCMRKMIFSSLNEWKADGFGIGGHCRL